MRISVCYNCTMRDYPKCHSGCRLRAEEVARNEAIREARRKDKAAHADFMAVTLRANKAKVGQR